MSNENIDKEIIELLLMANEIIQYAYLDWDEKYRGIKEINDRLSKYPTERIEKIIKSLEDNGYIEHAYIYMINPKKSNVITVYKKGCAIWVSPGEILSLIHPPQISAYKIFRRSIPDYVLEKIYYKIIDTLFPVWCFCKLNCPCDMDDVYADSVTNVLKLIGAKSIKVITKDKKILFKLSRKKIKYWFGGSITNANPLYLGEALLKGLKIIKQSESIVQLFHFIEVYNKKDNPDVIFEIAELGDPGGFYGFEINNIEYEKKIVEIIKECAYKYKCTVVVENECGQAREYVI